MQQLHIAELERGTVANESGDFEITGLCRGNYTIKISHIGCEPVVKTVAVKGKTYVNFYPEHHISRLRSLEIQAQRMSEQSTQAT
ncbi:MAG: carboxypeptidase-like regulatory domain-containing protein [Bacteroidia bacterium]